MGNAAMSRVPYLTVVEDDQQAADRQTGSLAGLAFTIAIIVASLFVIKQLQASTAMEDCILAGRLSCGMTIYSQGAFTRHI